MFNVIIEGFKTREQAEAFINWYEGQGEQDIIPWFEDRKLEIPTVDCKATYPIDELHLVECRQDPTLVIRLKDGGWHK